MSHLYKEPPGAKDLADLDSFDLAFLVLTGYVRMVPLLEEVVTVLKRDASVYLWGPYSKMTEKVLVQAWREQGGEEFTKALLSSFDLSGDLSVNREKVEDVFKKYRNVPEKAWFKARPKIIPILLDTAQGAVNLFKRRRKRASKDQKKRSLTEELFTAWATEAQASHIGAFIEKYPDRVLHPEVQRLVKIVEQSPERRLIDKAVLKQRILEINKMPSSYFTNVSDVHVGRLWTLSGLVYARTYKVTEYQVVAERDKRTCPVCQRLDGRHFSVQKAVDRHMKYLGAGLGRNEKNLDDAIKLFPFPRESDIDNKSPEDVRNFGWSPPFHPSCRCDVVMLWKTSVTDQDESAIPEIYTGRKRLDIPPAKVPRGSVKKTVESIAEGIGASTRDGEFSNSSDARRAKAMVTRNLSIRMRKLKSKSWENYVKQTCGKDVLDAADHELACSDLVAQWAVTSGDDSKRSIALQLAAKEEFGLKGTLTWWSSNAIEGAEILYAEHGEALRLFLREMYNETQEYLKERGIKKLRLFRGLLLEEKHAGDLVPASEGTNFVKMTTMKMQPMSSFSVNPITASTFAEPNVYHPVAIVMFADVPAERIMSCPMTGFGCLREYEAVVLASRDNTDNVAYLMTNLAAKKAKSPADVSKLFAEKNPEFFSKWKELVESKLKEAPLDLLHALMTEEVVGKALPLIHGAAELK